MKTIKLQYLIIMLVVISFSLPAQIPNPGFENWTAGSPTSWLTTNITGYATPITQSTEAHSGTYAAKGAVVTIQGVPVPMTAQMSAGAPGSGFTVSSRPKTFSMWYKFNSASEDIFYFQVVLFKDTTTVGHSASLVSAASSYTKISQDFTYLTPDIPNNAYVQIGIGPKQSNSLAHVGSYYIVDDLAFEGTATDVQSDNTIPDKFELKQNYPNPFNPNTLIEFSIPFKSPVKITVYSLIGQKVAELVNKTMDAGRHIVNFSGENLTSGVYFYKLEAGSYISTRKMILTK